MNSEGLHQCSIELIEKEKLFGDDWSNTAQNQLIAWATRAVATAGIHGKQAKKFKFIYQCLSILLIVLTSASAAVVLMGAHTAGALVALSASFVTSLLLKVKPEESFLKHSNAVAAYDNLVRTVEYMTTLPTKKRPDVEVAYVLVTTAMDNIATTAPPIALPAKPSFPDLE
jgi:hypothetical protein